MASSNMRILVCGGRDFDDRKLLFDTLDNYWTGGPLHIISGGAKGADSITEEWFRSYWDGMSLGPLSMSVYPADWSNYGKAAGPIRNQQMLDEGKPDLVIAFPGGSGTADMVRRAKKAGVKVVDT